MDRICKYIKIIWNLLAFVVSTALIIIGYRSIGYLGFTIQIIGLAGLLTLLYRYNRRYTK